MISVSLVFRPLNGHDDCSICVVVRIKCASGANMLISEMQMLAAVMVILLLVIRIPDSWRQRKRRECIQ